MLHNGFLDLKLEGTPMSLNVLVIEDESIVALQYGIATEIITVFVKHDLVKQH